MYLAQSTVRKRTTSKSANTSDNDPCVTFNIIPESRVTTDTTSGGGFQKAVRFTTNLAIMVTGGADGFFRVWQVSTSKAYNRVSYMPFKDLRKKWGDTLQN